MFTEAQQRALVGIARDAVAEHVAGRKGGTPRVEHLPEASGAFVTLKKKGALRGCIGTLECRAPLAEEVAAVAVCAARAGGVGASRVGGGREDPRLEPVRASELDEIDVEVSVLGPLEQIDPL